MAHDFKKFPELSNSQMALYYFESPHKQIIDSFTGIVVDVHDGDTVKIKTDFRDFDTKIRLTGINAPELKEVGGLESKNWLSERILNKEVDVVIDPANRVGKFGRLIANILFGGEDMSEASLRDRQSREFGFAPEGTIPSLEVIFK